MRVALVGAGALGSTYAARLALLGKCDFSIIASVPVPADTVRIERVDNGDAMEWMRPEGIPAVPQDADIVVVCVRYEQLDAAAKSVGRGSAPVVVMTPTLPQDYARLNAALPTRIVLSMPGVVAYRSERGVVRYWLPRLATTLIELRAAPGAEAEFVNRLVRAGIAAKLDPEVLQRNIATTLSFLPLAIAVDVGGGIDTVLRNDELLALAIDAAKEGRALGQSLGKPPAWAAMLMRFVGPLVLKGGVAIARARAPEALQYTEEHFGHKLHAQNVAMAQAILALAREKGAKRHAMERLFGRL
jgi:2-dehydropantoate 2-reductase